MQRVEDLLAEENLLAVRCEDENDGCAPRATEPLAALLGRPSEALRGLEKLLQPQVRHLQPQGKSAVAVRYAHKRSDLCRCAL